MAFFLKGTIPGNKSEAVRRQALARHCTARLVLILLLMGRQVFFNRLWKKGIIRVQRKRYEPL